MVLQLLKEVGICLHKSKADAIMIDVCVALNLENSGVWGPQNTGQTEEWNKQYAFILLEYKMMLIIVYMICSIATITQHRLTTYRI